MKELLERFLSARRPGLLGVAVACVVAAALLVLVRLLPTIDAAISGDPMRAFTVGDMRAFSQASAGTRAPGVPFEGPGGDTRLSDFEGRYVLLNLWATWCAPCVEEMPALARLAAAMPKDRFVVIAVSIDRQGAEVAAPFLEGLGINGLDLYSEPRLRLLPALGVEGIPISVLYGPDGREIGRLSGAARWDGAEARALFAHVMREAP